MFQFIVACFLSIFLSIFLWCIYTLIKDRLSGLNHIPGWKLRNPIFGTIVDSGSMEMLERYKYEYENFGTVYRLYMPLSMLYVVITDPQIAKHILQTNSKNYIRPPLKGMGVFRRLVGPSSILLSNDESHRIQRSLATPAFTPANIRQLIPIFLECGNHLIDRLSVIADHGLIDIRSELSKCTLDIIGNAGFGYDFGCIHSDDREENGRASKSVKMVMDYVTNFRLWYYLPYSDWLPIKANRNFNEGLKQLHEMTERMIDERTKLLGDGYQKECKNLLDMMIAGTSEKSIDRLSLRDQLMTFLMAGHETTSLALSYILYFLCKNLDWQDRCRNEVSQVSETEFSYECDKMKETKAVILESLRLLPPVFALARQAVNDDKLGQYSIPGSTSVAVLVTQMHRIPAYWGENADKFDPERFLQEEKIPWDAYMPFGEGMRKCVGYKFALNEIIVLLAVLLKHFYFRLDPSEVYREMTFFGIVTMLPVRPIRVTLRKV